MASIGAETSVKAPPWQDGNSERQFRGNVADMTAADAPATMSAGREDHMWLGYFRHGATAALALGAVAIVFAALLGAIELRPWQIIVGALLFYLTEYGMHRFAFHAAPARQPFVLKLQRRLHYDHHVEPNRLDLLFLPLWFLVPNLAVTALAVALVLGKSAVGAVMLGVMLAILHYEWVHYVAHIPYQPRTPFGPLAENLSPASSLRQREGMVRGQQSLARSRVRDVPRSTRCEEERHRA